MEKRDFVKLCAAGVIIPSVVPVRNVEEKYDDERYLVDLLEV